MKNRSFEFWKPHKGQEGFLRCDAKIRVLACGRRWGKTDACAAGIVESLLRDTKGEGLRAKGGSRTGEGLRAKSGNPSPGSSLTDLSRKGRGESARKHIILAPTQDQASLLFERVVEMLDSQLGAKGEGLRAKGRKIRRSPYPRLDFEGHRVIARSGHHGRSLRGNQATDVVIDEAAFVPEKLISEVVFPMLATTNGSLTLISTPSGMNHFWRWFKMGEESGEKNDKQKTKNEEPETPLPVPSSPTSPTRGEVTPAKPSIWSKQAPSWESPYVSSDFLEAQKELISERAFRVEYGAEFLDSTGRVFRTEAIDACLVAEESFAVSRKPLAEGTPHPVRSSPTSPARGEVNPLWALPPFFIGIDWARYEDYTAVVVLSGNRRGARVVCAERFHGMSWPDLVEGVAAICERYSECLAMCDATGRGTRDKGQGARDEGRGMRDEG